MSDPVFSILINFVRVMFIPECALILYSRAIAIDRKKETLPVTLVLLMNKHQKFDNMAKLDFTNFFD